MWSWLIMKGCALPSRPSGLNLNKFETRELDYYLRSPPPPLAEQLIMHHNGIMDESTALEHHLLKFGGWEITDMRKFKLG